MSTPEGVLSYEEDRPPDEPPGYVGFYEEVVPALVAMLQILGASRDDAAECVQETMIKALPPRWYELTNRRAWCRKVATNTFYRLVRRRRREFLCDDVTRLGVPLFAEGDHCRDIEEADAVRRLLKTLPGRCREVLAWHIGGAGYAEIAQELGISESTVRTHVARGRLALERIVPKSGEGRT